MKVLTRMNVTLEGRTFRYAANNPDDGCVVDDIRKTKYWWCDSGTGSKYWRMVLGSDVTWLNHIADLQAENKRLSRYESLYIARKGTDIDGNAWVYEDTEVGKQIKALQEGTP